MKPATRIVFILVNLIALLHAVRLVLGTSVVIGGVSIPVWISAVAAPFFAALSFGFWREQADRGGSRR